MIRRFLILTITFLFLIEISGQSLARKGSIGIFFKATNDSITNVLGLDRPGLLVQEIVPGSTAEALLLKTDDVILSVNGQRMTNHAELFAFGLRLFETDQISIDILRDGKRHVVSGSVLFKPMDTLESGERIDGAVPLDMDTGGLAPEATSLLGRDLYPMKDSPKSKAKKDQQLLEAKQNYQQDPANLENIIWYGRRLAYLSRYGDAIKIYSKGLERHPNAAELYRHRGHRYVSIREFDKAIADFNAAVENMQGRPLDVEADGMPNKQNIPLSNLQFNVWYHLGLAYYLQADFTNAILAYENCMAFSNNDDLVTATADWLYMSYMRNGESDKAAILLDLIHPDMNIIENDAYFKRLLMYKGLMQPEELLAFNDLDEENELSIVTQGYGVGNYYMMKGDKEKAKEIFEKILKTNYWSAFGYVAAEAEIYRLTK